MTQSRGKLVGRVAEHELDIQFLADSGQWFDLIALHAYADHDDARVAERGALSRKAVRHFEQEKLGQPHQLAVAAGIIVRVAHRFDAGRSDQHRHRANAGTRLQMFLRLRSVVDHLGAELVAHYDIALEVHHERSTGFARTFNQPLGVLERVQIRAANPAGERFHQRLARPGSRNWNLIDDKFFASHYGSAHFFTPFEITSLTL